MQIRSLAIRLVLVALVALSTSSCYLFDQLRALRVIKDAHTQYQRSDYVLAAELYEEVLENDPDLVEAYFYLANSYDQQFRPALRGEPENDEMLDRAIDNYIISAERQTYLELQTLSLQWLVEAYGPEKANDPASSEIVLQTMIDTDAENPDNYYRLARLYEDSGLFDEAEQVLLRVTGTRPDDPAAHLQMAGFYRRNDQFDDMMTAVQRRAELEPENPEAYYTIATYYWEEAFRNFTLSDDVEMEYVLLGIAETDKALELNADYVEALTYKNILLRMQANLTDNVRERNDLIDQADELRDRAQELQDLRTGAGGD